MERAPTHSARTPQDEDEIVLRTRVLRRRFASRRDDRVRRTGGDIRGVVFDHRGFEEQRSGGREADLFCIPLRVNYGWRGAVARRAERKHDLSLRVAKDPRGGKRAQETEQRTGTTGGRGYPREEEERGRATSPREGSEGPRMAGNPPFRETIPTADR